MLFTYNRKIIGELNTYEDLISLIDKKSKNNLPFKNYDKVKLFFDEILSRESIGMKHFIREWRDFYTKTYPNNGNKHINYYLIRGYCEDEAVEMIRSIQSNLSLKGNNPESIKKRVDSWKRNKSNIKTSRGREFYKLKGLTEEEIDTKIQKRNDKWMQSLEDYIERTGDNFHDRKGCDYQYFLDKYGQDEADIIFSKRNPFLNTIEKHGDSWKDYVASKRPSRKNLTKIYGKDIADEKIYQANRKRILNTRKNKKGISSNIELDFYTTLDDEWEQQKIIKGNNSVVYIFDFYNESKNELIEFQGDYWHCNPKKYKPDYFHTLRKMYASEIWNFDVTKKKQAEEQGWNVEYIWESDYLEVIKTRIQSDRAIN